ncbi:unnamed protein product [Boreogadus saida]
MTIAEMTATTNVTLVRRWFVEMWVLLEVAAASEEPDKCLVDFPEVFTACAGMRVMARAQTEKTLVRGSKSASLPGPSLPDRALCSFTRGGGSDERDSPTKRGKPE